MYACVSCSVLCVLCVALLFFLIFYRFSSIDRRSYHVFRMVKSCNNHCSSSVIQQICLFVCFCRPTFFFVVRPDGIERLVPSVPAAHGPARKLSAPAHVRSQELRGGYVRRSTRTHIRTLVHINGSRKEGLTKGTDFISNPEQVHGFFSFNWEGGVVSVGEGQGGN